MEMNLYLFIKARNFFLQGLPISEQFNFYLARWMSPAQNYIWVGLGDDKYYPVDGFLRAKIWEGKSFWELEEQMTWVDA